MFDYDEALRARLGASLDEHERRRLPLEGRRHAAVAVVVVDSDRERDDVEPVPEGAVDMAGVPGGPVGADGRRFDGRMVGVAGGAAFLLCRRSLGMRRHAGQWALPGGRVDPGEEPLAAARRELHEELGLELGEEAVLGALDDYPTRSGYVIRPYVLWGGADPALVPDPIEVASVHRISLRELCRHDSPRLVTIAESDRPVIQIPIGGDLIHAPTGAVLYQFRLAALEGDPAPCDHYEQPVFAWG